jgi:hypothetical protein
MNDDGSCLPDMRGQRRRFVRPAVLIVVLYAVALVYVPVLWMLRLPPMAIAAVAPAAVALTGQLCHRLWVLAHPRQTAAMSTP